VFSSIDHGGRYAYANQPGIAQWNLARLAEAMLPLFDADQEQAVARATVVLERFPQLFNDRLMAGLRAKLGLFAAGSEDEGLVNELLAWMREQGADFTNTFAALTRRQLGDAGSDAGPLPEAWLKRWDARRARQNEPADEAAELMRLSNPAFIPRNHLVEEALRSAAGGDLSVMQQLLDVLATPFDYGRHLPRYAEPGVDQRAYKTFCGT
jgi:uncharacterized protein YdiU (UPF0061 family)